MHQILRYVALLPTVNSSFLYLLPSVLRLDLVNEKLDISPFSLPFVIGTASYSPSDSDFGFMFFQLDNKVIELMQAFLQSILAFGKRIWIKLNAKWWRNTVCWEEIWHLKFLIKIRYPFFDAPKAHFCPKPLKLPNWFVNELFCRWVWPFFSGNFVFFEKSC